MASGGSSGERGTFVFDCEALGEFLLSNVRPPFARLQALGITAGNPVPGAVVAAASPVHATGLFGAVLGEGGPVNMTPTPATLPLATIVDRLNGLQPLVLVGYPTILSQLAAEQNTGSLAIAPVAVGASSEPLASGARRAIETAFGVPMTNSFGSTEGLCGASAPGEEAITFADDLCIMELVDEHDQPVPSGQTSAKVLLTNLYNHTQPLIRYELNDCFTEVAGPHPDGHLRAVVEGRNDAPFRYGDRAVHPLVIRSVLVHAGEVFEYQVRQTVNGVCVYVVAEPSLDASNLSRRLTGALCDAGLNDVVATVQRVEQVERDPITGKARRFIPLA